MIQYQHALTSEGVITHIGTIKRIRLRERQTFVNASVLTDRYELKNDAVILNHNKESIPAQQLTGTRKENISKVNKFVSNRENALRNFSNL